VVAQEYDTKQTKQWLAWLARNMQLHNQEVFLVENLQPSWLHNRLWRLVYVIASRLLFGLIFGLMVRRENGLIQGLIYGLTVWLAVSSFDIYRLEWLDNWRDRKRVTNFWWSVINIVSIGLFFGLTDGLANGLLFGLFFGLRGSRRKWINDTQTIESLHWYWGKALKGGLRDGLIAGVIFGLFIGLSRGMKDGLSYGLVDGLSAAVTLGLIFAPMGAILNGLGYEIVETKSVTNQGMRLTIRNSIISGLFTFLLTGLIAWLIEGLIVGLSNGIIHGLEIGIGFGLIGTLWYGCFDVIQHYTLRLLLIIQGYTPHNFARFLDYAVNRIFLQKVGGGYRFIHRMLLEHFAETYEPEKGHG